MVPKPEQINISQASSSKASGFVNNAYEDDGIVSKNPTMADVDLSVPAGKDGTEKPLLDFDDLLPHIGEFGLYQKLLFLCMIPFAFFVAFVYFSQIFMTLVPEEHWCRVPELEHLNLTER